MAKYIVFEEECPRAPRAGDHYRCNADEIAFRAHNEPDVDKRIYPILRRLTDAEVDALVAAKPTWTDIWVCSGCGKRSTDIDDRPGLWRWLGDHYEHGCVGEGQARIYEPARFFGKAVAPKPADDERERFVRETAAMVMAHQFAMWTVAEIEDGDHSVSYSEGAIDQIVKAAESLAARLWEKRS